MQLLFYKQALVITRSYGKMLSSNEDYYMKIAQNASSDFAALLNEAHTSALQLSIDSRDRTKSAYKLQPKFLRDNAYYYLSATQVLSEYSRSRPFNVMLYYSDLDILITPSYHYAPNDYISSILKRENSVTVQKFREFLRASKQGELNLFPSSQSMDENILHVAIPIRIGNDREPVVALYAIKPEAMKGSSLAAVQQMDDTFFAVFDENQRLLFQSGSVSLFTREQVNNAAIINSIQFFYSNQERRVKFCCKNETFPFYISLVLPYDQVTNNIEHFYKTLQLIAAFSTILLLAAVGVMLRINYKPIFQIVRRFGTENAHDEFKALEESFEQIESENSDKSMLILDLLCRNMLYGVPIPQKQIEWLHLDLGHLYYCVLTVEPLKFNSSESMQLTSALFSDLNVQAFITDLLPEDKSVIIAFMPTQDNVQLQNYIHDWVSAHIPGLSVRICAGKTVNSVNDICHSFRSCIQSSTQNDVEPETAQPSNNQAFTSIMQDVLNYIEQHYNDKNLSRTMVADKFRISVYSLSRLFKSQLEIGFSEYLTSCRLTHVVKLLLETDKSIVEIADACGFSSANYLSKLFKSAYHMTPLQYRKTENKAKS